jgi:hypothetical protein
MPYYDVTNVETKEWTEIGTILKNPIEITPEELTKYKHHSGVDIYDV